MVDFLTRSWLWLLFIWSQPSVEPRMGWFPLFSHFLPPRLIWKPPFGEVQTSITYTLVSEQELKSRRPGHPHTVPMNLRPLYSPSSIMLLSAFLGLHFKLRKPQEDLRGPSLPPCPWRPDPSHSDTRGPPYRYLAPEEQPHMDFTVWTSAHVQKSKGRPSEMQQITRASDGAERMSPVTVLDGKLQPQRKQPAWLACKHIVFIGIFSAPHCLWGGDGHLLWAWAGAHHCYATEGQRQKPRKEGFLPVILSVYWSLRWCLAVILHGSLRAPL